MAELMHRAFTLALHERGPVQVNIPRDYFYGEGDYEILPPLVIERAAVELA
jgi:sulfoacetaldehyde acetyltransferase